jgi:hypothetical protein
MSGQPLNRVPFGSVWEATALNHRFLLGLPSRGFVAGPSKSVDAGGCDQPASPIFLPAMSTMARPISRDAVAAGDGTFRTCSIFSD